MFEVNEWTSIHYAAKLYPTGTIAGRMHGIRSAYRDICCTQFLADHRPWWSVRIHENIVRCLLIMAWIECNTFKAVLAIKISVAGRMITSKRLCATVPDVLRMHVRHESMSMMIMVMVTAIRSGDFLLMRCWASRLRNGERPKLPGWLAIGNRDRIN